MNNIEKIFEDDDVLVINKPAGFRVHQDDFGEGETIADWFAGLYPEAKEVGEPMTLTGGEIIQRPGIVHRLDKDTSGALILAKKQSAFVWLKKQFQEHRAQKTYWLLVSGVLKKEGLQVMDWPIGRSKKDPRIRVASRRAVGKLRPAKTRYRVLKRFTDFTLVEAYPETGRTHQLRAHFKALSYPVACDSLYNPKGVCPPGIYRQALHARRLVIDLPSGQKGDFTASLSSDFSLALDNLSLA